MIFRKATAVQIGDFSLKLWSLNLHRYNSSSECIIIQMMAKALSRIGVM